MRGWATAEGIYQQRGRIITDCIERGVHARFEERSGRVRVGVHADVCGVC